MTSNEIEKNTGVQDFYIPVYTNSRKSYKIIKGVVSREKTVHLAGEENNHWYCWILDVEIFRTPAEATAKAIEQRNYAIKDLYKRMESIQNKIKKLESINAPQ